MVVESSIAGPAPLVDANLLLWAHHAGFEHHATASRWWAATLTSTPRVGIPWPTILAFLRISTHVRALERPITIERAWAVVDGWLSRPNVWTPLPTVRHPGILAGLLVGGNAAGNHTTDAHLAALALEWGLELLSADHDFSRYRDLRWRNPLVAG